VFRNYLKTSIRSLLKNKLHSSINLIGLTIGIAVCLLVSTYVHNELSYDNFHTNAEYIHRVESIRNEDGNWIRIRVTPPGIADKLLQEFPEIKSVTRVSDFMALLKYNNNSWNVDRFALVDSTFLNIFDFPLLRGDPANALNNPLSIILTESSAHLIFGNEDPIGKSITLYNRFELTVTGIMEDFPENSHIQYDYLCSLSSLKNLYGDESILDNLSNYSLSTYVLLDRFADPDQLRNKFHDFYCKYYGEEDAERHGFGLLSLADVHLMPGALVENADVISKQQLYILSIIAFFVLLLACINFINLSTAHSSQRVREIGLRKVLGANRHQLIWQFLLESIILSILSIPIAFGLAEISLPTFSSFVGKNLTLSSMGASSIIGSLVLIIIFIGVIAGSYPAFYISKFQPVAIVRKNLPGNSKRKCYLRKTLIVVQYSIALILMIGTLTILRQSRFLKSHDTGFDKEQVIFTDMNYSITDHYDAFRQELLAYPQITNVACGSNLPGWQSMDHTYQVETQDELKPMQINTMVVEPEYINALNINLIEGRNFSNDIKSDKTESYIINEALVAKLGWDNNSLGKSLNLGDRQNGKVIGVVKDFNYKSLHNEIEPLVLRLDEGYKYVLLIKINPHDIEKTVSSIEEVWKKYASGFPFEYGFLDVTLERLYNNEKQLGEIIVYSAMIALCIACLGLFGLTAYTTDQRTKEIGIRKVLGARIIGLVFILTKEFTAWVILSILVACPIAYYILTKWLENFAYRVELSFNYFLISGLIAIIVSLLTISFHTIKTSLINPVINLRHE
jgi:putative ABC transport system permease protein